MRSCPWLLLLSLVLSVRALAQEISSPFSTRERILVAPARPGEVPPMKVHVAGNVPTLLRFDTHLTPNTPGPSMDETRIRLIPVEEGTFILLPSSDVPPEEQVPLTVRTENGLLRFSLVTRRAETDVRVRVVPSLNSSEEDTAEIFARHLLTTARARASLVLPQRGAVQQKQRSSLARVDSVLWMGRRFFVTLTVTSPRKSARPWRLVQVRLKTTLSDGAQREWPARLMGGETDSRRQQHVATGLLPEGASELKLALDGEDAVGAFRALDPNKEPASP